MPLEAILSIHNRYQQPGGEDRVFAAEAALLENRGHRIARYTDSNERISNGFVAGLATVWNQVSYRRLRATAQDQAVNIAHLHNTFPLISPAGYYALRRQRVPIVQTLSNFRLVCPGSLLLRDGEPCEECIEQKSLRPALAHRCYRESLTATAAVCGMIAAHRAAGTWNRAVDAYIALSHFARAKFIEGGLPENRIVVKRNFIDRDPGVGEGGGSYALFVGRLSAEKGISTLLDAWRRQPGMPLKIAGDGPLNTSEWPHGVEWLGQQSEENVIRLMKNATVLIFPSICYENAPMTILEAFACGLPVIASDRGSIPELVTDHLNGLLFRPGDADDLVRQVGWAFDNPDRTQEMRAAARREFEANYTAEIGYKRLIEAYEFAIENHSRTAKQPTWLQANQLGPQPQLITHQRPLSRSILGVRVDSTTYADATGQILHWAQSAEPRYVCCAAVHSIMEAHDSDDFRRVMNCADLVTSDGMPLVWLLRLLGIRSAQRVYGPDLTRHVLRAAEQADLPVGFFGGSEAVLASLVRHVAADHPALRIVYAESPPFRPSTPDEDTRTVDAITNSRARIVFVGLSTPTQDLWMHAHRDKIPAVMLGVGAAFDFLAGAKPQAPKWMQSSGLEWLFRLATEPRRLWRRYLRHNPRFAVLAIGQLFRTRQI